MAQVKAPRALAWEGQRVHAHIGMQKELGQVAATDAAEARPDPNPVGVLQRWSGDIVHTQGGDRTEIDTVPYTRQDLGEYDSRDIDVQPNRFHHASSKSYADLMDFYFDPVRAARRSASSLEISTCRSRVSG